MARATWLFGATTAALLASGCGGIRLDEPPPPPPPPVVSLAGSWTGTISMEGQPLAGTLMIRQNGAELDATLTAPSFGVEARGDGEVEQGDRVELELAYDVQCPGTARLSGEILDGGTRMVGSVTASDCTGSARGDFRFDRR